MGEFDYSDRDMYDTQIVVESTENTNDDNED